MPGMSTTHTQVHQSSSLGVSVRPGTLIQDTSKQISAPFAPACRKRKHADVQEDNGRIGPPFTIQVLRIALYRYGVASLMIYERKTLHFHLQNPKGLYQGY